MDISAFGDRKTGSLTPITQPRRGFAFIPNPLPPDWEFPNELWPLLVEARDMLGTLNGIGQTLPDPQLLLRPLQSREAITSSSIEGTYVTPEQLLMYELDPRESRHAHDKVSDWQEVHNYNRALQCGFEMLRELPFCFRIVKEMHRILMQGVRGMRRSPGEFRKWQVQIGSNARFVPPPPEYVNSLMTAFETYMNSEADSYDPLALVRVYLAHYQFEAIHPFADGNGRIGRVLLALMTYKWLGHSLPWLYMSPYFERYKDEYIRCLFRVSTEGAWTDWTEFCLRGTIEQANDSIRRCNHFNQLRKEYHDRIDSGTPRTHNLIEQLFRSPIVAIPYVQHDYGITYPTAKRDVMLLVEAGILKVLSASMKPKMFYAPEIMRTAYDEHVGDQIPGREPPIPVAPQPSPTDGEPPFGQSHAVAPA